MIELTEEQSRLLEAELKWFRNYENGNYIGEHPQWFAYSGAAGCGKTTVAKEFIKAAGISNLDYIGCAYTGKAVLQMQKNGLVAKTIHSLIYDIRFVYKENPETGKKYEATEFVLKTKLERDYRLIIVDEAAMVNDDMIIELLSFGVPIIFMGDMNQLPPVFGVSSVMNNPNFILTKIMRQNEDDPIVRLSQMVLKGLPLMEGQYGKSSIVREYELTRNTMTEYDQILCMTNKTRSDINTFIRSEFLGRKTTEPKLFDKIICRQNNWDIRVHEFPLTNGTSGWITDIHRDKLASGYYRIDFHPDYFEKGIDFEDLYIDAKYIKSTCEEQRNYPRTRYEKFEYAYAITVHLSQGSEYDNVLFVDSYFHDEDLTRKARYTAITRAKNKVTIVINQDFMRR